MADRDALRASHGLLPAVLASRSSILIAVDADGQVVVWNRGAAQAFGIDEEAVAGRPFAACPIAWDWARIQRIAPGGISVHPLRLVEAFRRRDGSTGMVAMQILPQHAPDGSITGCVWLGSETTSSVQRPAGSAGGPVWARPPATTRFRTPAPEAPAPAQAPPEAARRFPVHAAFLDAHLVASGEDPGHWRIAAAAESRLDERGMEVAFALVRRIPPPTTLQLRVLVAAGELVAVSGS
ncbi:MAG: hypothetical protein RLZZ127_1698 [Planctomycetota bacterium]|jgi:PAS domain S-box-containing protein